MTDSFCADNTGVPVERRVAAIVPVKPLVRGKSRLAERLRGARPVLSYAMVWDVLGALQAADVFTRVVVVSSDCQILALARRFGCLALEHEDDIAGAGLNNAVAAGAARCAAEGFDFCAVVPGDLPLLDAGSVAQCVRASLISAEEMDRRGAIIAPCKDGVGTNFLFFDPMLPPDLRFGPGSFQRHRAGLNEAGRPVRVLAGNDPGADAFAFDVDDADDFETLSGLISAGAASAVGRFFDAYGFFTDFPIDGFPDFLFLEDVAARVRAFDVWCQAEAAPLEDLMQAAAAVRDSGHGKLITYSRKVFVPLTRLCRDVCHYCVFAKSPRQVAAPFLSLDEVREIVRAGQRAGCHEVLLTLGEKPELRYGAARDWLDVHGFSSTVDYVAHVAETVLRETGLLPHVNAGCLTSEDLLRLKTCAPSVGLMLENVSPRLCARGGPHYGSPDKDPVARLATLEAAGREKVPCTSGLLIGIGETRGERFQSLTALYGLHQKYGHIQEIIIQNFAPKTGTKMAEADAATEAELLWTIAAARLLFGTEMSIQAPPNLAVGGLSSLIDAGINDWGGVSPVTPDHVNPEAPWPHLDRLEQETACMGKALVQRLTVYPDYALAADQWLSVQVRPYVLQRMDGQGLARADDWISGVSTDVPESGGFLLSSSRSGKVDSGSGVSADIASILSRSPDDWRAEDISFLFSARGDDFHFVCQVADRLRRMRRGDDVSYVINRNINYTNICSFGCTFCAFSKGPRKARGGDAPYTLSLSAIVERAVEAEARGATEVCLQGGIHPSYDGETYLDICTAVRTALPDMHIHAFSPLEVLHGARSLGLPVARYLSLLKQAGLNSLPGTAAEILVDDVRAVLCPDKLSTEEWLDVVRTAHGVGLPTTATVMFGHVETYTDWAQHLLTVRALQRETGGITEFVPLGFVAHEAPLYRKGIARRGPTFREAVLMHAVARLVLDPFITNIQTSWVKMGVSGALACLNAGANDIGGTLMNESITRAAGARHGQEMSPARLLAAVDDIGRPGRQRTTLYDEPRRGLWAERHVDAQMVCL